MFKREEIKIRLSEREKDLLKQKCKAENISISEKMRMLIQNDLFNSRSRKRPYETR